MIDRRESHISKTMVNKSKRDKVQQRGKYYKKEDTA
jgi:hypothetical protein